MPVGTGWTAVGGGLVEIGLVVAGAVRSLALEMGRLAGLSHYPIHDMHDQLQRTGQWGYH